MLQTKAHVAIEKSSSYFLVGPFCRNKDYRGIFEFCEPEELYLKNAIQYLKNEGLPVYFGKWQIDGKPNAILVDFLSLVPKLNEIKYYFSEATNGIRVPDEDFSANDSIMFGSGVGRFLDRVIEEKMLLEGRQSKSQNNSTVNNVCTASCCAKSLDNSNRQEATKEVESPKALLMHCHEWITGSAIIFCRRQAKNRDRIGTIFTTHATTLGRFLSSDNFNLYEGINSVIDLFIP